MWTSPPPERLFLTMRILREFISPDPPPFFRRFGNRSETILPTINLIHASLGKREGKILYLPINLLTQSHWPPPFPGAPLSIRAKNAPPPRGLIFPPTSGKR